MSKGVRRAAVAIAVGATTLTAGVAAAATVENGGFEDGFAFWGYDSNGGGIWGSATSASGIASPPPEGTYAAFATQSGPSSNVLYQDVHLENNMKHRVTFQLAYHSGAPFFTPNNLSEEGGGGMGKGGTATNPNQQFRVDVMKRSAGLRSLKDDDVLKQVFRTETGDEPDEDWFKVRTSLTKLAGRTVRLRFAEVDNQENFTVGVDAVKVKTTAP